MIAYPVGRHLAFRSLETNIMKFLKLPNNVKHIQAITFSHGLDKVAIAVRIMEPEENDRINLSVLFYQIDKTGFKKKKDEQIKLTQTRGGMGGIQLSILNNPNNLQVTTPSVKKQSYFQRYVQSMAFSNDDKFFVVNICNGTNESYVQVYDYMIMKGKIYSMAKFDQTISKVKFINKDSSKVVIAGQNIFQFYSCNSKILQELPEFDDIPIRKDQIMNQNIRIKQNFISFCYAENDQLLCCSNMGDVFVIEIMSVVQIIKADEFIQPGTQVGNRMQFKKIVSNKFGFVIHTSNILYFFEFRPWVNPIEKQNKALSFKSDIQNKDQTYKGQLNTTKLKGTYHCILKWRAEEFRETEILDVSVSEGLTQQESTMSVSTKDGQIICLNLYSQVYFPDHIQIMKNLKSEENRGQDSENSFDEEDEKNSQIANQFQKQNSIKCIGIDEEKSIDFLLKEYQKNKINSPQEKQILDQLEEQVLIDQINYTVIGNGFHKGEISSMDICIHRPIIATLSKGDSTVRVWNYSSGLCELEKSYQTHQKEFQNSNQTYLQSIALHPSGLILAIGFIDKVKVFHIIHQELKEFQSLVDIRNCSIMKFSNGGQILACVGVKDINLFNTFALDKPRKVSCPSNLVSQIDFNYDDSTIIVVSKDGFVRKYDIIKDQKTGEGVIDKQVEFTSCIFSWAQAPVQTKHSTITDQSKNLQTLKTPQQMFVDKIFTVGGYHSGEQMIRCYNEKETIENEIKNLNPFGKAKYTDIVEIIRDTSKGNQIKESDVSLNSKGFKKDKIVRNLVISNSSGQIFIYGSSPNMKDGRECEVINTHIGQINCLKIHHDYSILVSAGSDGVIIVYQVQEVSNKNAGSWSKKTAQYILKMEKEKKLANSSQDFSAMAEQQQSLQEIDEQNEDSQEHSSRNTFNVQIKHHQQKQENSESEDSEEHENLDISKLRKDFGLYNLLLECIDSRLSNIGLIDKQTMEEWRKQQEDLKQYMEKQNSSVEEKLKNARNTNHKQIDEMEKRKSEHLNKLNKDYLELQLQEAELKDENTQTMKTMEVNHLECIEELQGLYEKKLQMEQAQYNKLKQAKDEEQNQYEERIKQMQKMSEQAIEKLLNDFKDELQIVQDEYDKAKRKADGTKMKYEEKLTQQDDDDTGEIRYLKKVNEEEIQQLNDVIETIKEDIETIKRQAAREEGEKENYKQITEKAKYKKQFRLELMKEKIEEIQHLETEKKEIQLNLKQKEMKLFNLKFQIKDLQKTKQVLTHRTQEMKASLEPKEQQIETLKDQLLDLEKCFEKQTFALKNLTEEVKSRNQKIGELQNKVQKEKNNTKEKERIISDFVNAVHKAYKNKNEDKCIEDLMDIYKKYVKDHIEEILENKKKDPETIEELERQLQYMEKSIDTLRNATTKIQRKTKMNINLRRQENNALIQDLNDVRESKKKLENDKKTLELEIQKLKLEKQKKERDFERKLYNLYKRVNTKETKAGQDNEQDGFGDYKLPGETGNKQKKGYLYKGTPFLRGNAEDKQKIIEYEDKLKDNSEQILLLTLEKRSLQEQIIRLLNERADDFGLTEEEKKAQLSKLNFNDTVPLNGNE